MLKTMTKVAGILALLASAAFSQEGLWSLGTRIQGFWDLVPGNDYVLGPEIGYSNYNLAGHRLQFRIAYLTSRLENVFRPNVLKDDYFLFSPIWHFRRNALFDPTVHADLGYMRYDTEYEKYDVLDNSTWVTSLNLGLGLNLEGGKWGFHYQVGYHFFTPESGHVFPLVFGLGLWVML